jgi:hypothetical protein
LPRHSEAKAGPPNTSFPYSSGNDSPLYAFVPSIDISKILEQPRNPGTVQAGSFSVACRAEALAKADAPLPSFRN